MFNSQDRWICSECSASNRPYVRFCERCWKLRPGWLRNMRRRRKDSDDQEGEDVEVPNDQWSDQREDCDNPCVDVESDDAEGKGGNDVAVPVGLMDFDWGGENNPEYLKTDGGGGGGLNIDSLDRDDALAPVPHVIETLVTSPVPTATSAPSSASSKPCLTTSTASIPTSTADDDYEFRCESQASLFSQSSHISVASSDREEARSEAERATSSLSTAHDHARGSGATSSLSTIASQDSGFGSQDSFLTGGVAVAGDFSTGRRQLKGRDPCSLDALDVGDVTFFLTDPREDDSNSKPSIPSSSTMNDDPMTSSKFFASSPFSSSSSTPSKSSTLPSNLGAKNTDSSSSPSKFTSEMREEASEGRRYSFDRLTDNLAIRERYWRQYERGESSGHLDDSERESRLSLLDSQCSFVTDSESGRTTE